MRAAGRKPKDRSVVELARLRARVAALEVEAELASANELIGARGKVSAPPPRCSTPWPTTASPCARSRPSSRSRGRAA